MAKTEFSNGLSEWEATVLMNMHISDFGEKPVRYIISICIGKKREDICSKVLILNHHTSMSAHKPGVIPGPATPSHSGTRGRKTAGSGPAWSTE